MTRSQYFCKMWHLQRCSELLVFLFAMLQLCECKQSKQSQRDDAANLICVFCLYIVKFFFSLGRWGGFGGGGEVFWLDYIGTMCHLFIIFCVLSSWLLS